MFGIGPMEMIFAAIVAIGLIGGVIAAIVVASTGSRKE
jgi:hypothetical protein